MAEDSRAPCRKQPVEITKETIGEFMSQFDALVSDCDGVIWILGRTIPNAKEGFECLRSAGKKILFVSNNSAIPALALFKKHDFPIEEDEVVHPALAIAHYLKNMGFSKKAFVLATESFKNELRKCNITIVPEFRTGEVYPENVPLLVERISDDPGIGAVILDLDVNQNAMDLNKAVYYLRRPECLFLAGATDPVIPLPADGQVLIGPANYRRVLEEISGRKALVFGKPETTMIDQFLKETHSLDLKRTLFVGDTLEQDVGVGVACGMKTLLVLTGMTQLQDLSSCDPKLIPDFYIKSMADFVPLLQRPKM